jgi:hypothetical protein
MCDDTVLPSGFPAVGSRKGVAAFGGGRIRSDGGVMLLAAAERRIAFAAACPQAEVFTNFARSLQPTGP